MISQLFTIDEGSHLSSEQYDAYLKSRLSYNEAKAVKDTAFFDGEKKGRMEGKIEGKIEGQLEEKRETAKNMLVKGFDVDTIAEITKLTLQQIESLR